MIECPRCGGNACFVQKVNEEVNTQLCFGCGFTTSTLMEANSKIVLDALASSPELYKDLMFVDKDSRVWFPATITLPNSGMVFADGTSKENWKWAAVKSIEISEKEKKNFPKDQTHKMDMKSPKHFEQKDFMDGLSQIGFFDVAVQE